MPWGLIVDVAMRLIGLVIDDKAKRDQLKLQMYEFAKRFDKDAIEGNEKIREEYARIREELDKVV